MSISPAGLLLLTAQTPAPLPSEDPAHTIYTVTPGISGFIAFFVLALVGWLLFRSLVHHVRKVDVAAARRAREESLAAQEAAAADAPSTAAPSTAGTDRMPPPGEAPRGQATE